MSKTFSDGYTQELVRYPDILLNKLRELRSSQQVQFDTLVGTGMSGVVPLKAAADALAVNWLVVRKPDESSHASSILLGTLGERWLFVDDFVASGRTFERVLSVVNNAAIEFGLKTEFVGKVEYSSTFNWWSSREAMILRNEQEAKEGFSQLMGTSGKYMSMADALRSSVHNPDRVRNYYDR